MTERVYFLRAGERVKIGFSTEVEARIKTLQGATAEPLEVLAVVDGDMGLESALHRRLERYRLAREWFADCGEVRDVMADVQARGAEALGALYRRMSSRGLFASENNQPTRVIRPLLKQGRYEDQITEICEALNTSRRTAERLIVGGSVNAETTLAIITHDVYGPPYLTALLRNVPEDRRARLAEQLMLAAKLVWLEEEQINVAKVRR